MERIEQVILHSLVSEQEYSRKVLPFLKEEYFSGSSEERKLFNVIKEYVTKYSALPSKAAIYVEIDNIVDISEKSFKELKGLVETIYSDAGIHSLDWLIDNTEKFCQDSALYNAIMEAIQIVDSDKKSAPNKQLSKTAIPNILSNALSVSFDSRIGHDYVKEVEERFEYYQEKQRRIPFDIEMLNTVTNGGLTAKSMMILAAGTGVGKSLVMCHMAANNLTDGRNVLYLTLEMQEKECARRIDANLLDIDINQFSTIQKSKYTAEFASLKSKNLGRLIIKEYPPAAAHVGHFRHLLDELKLKEKFIPDVIYIDYLNICLSSRVKMSGSVNSYTFIKAVAEEIRGLAVEFNVPVISATQLNRQGYSNSDADLDDISESFGTAATADLVLGIISTDQLAELGQFMFKQMKNRYNDPTRNKKFVVGVDKAKMRLYNLESSAQNGMIGGNQTQNAAPQRVSAPTGKKNFGNLIV